VEEGDRLLDPSRLKDGEMGDVADRIQAFLQSDLRLDHRAALDDQSPLLEGLVDSLEVMRIISFVEEEFGVSLEIAEVTEDNFVTIAAIERLVHRKRTGTMEGTSPST
jgi:acyl carrier protein